MMLRFFLFLWVAFSLHQKILWDCEASEQQRGEEEEDDLHGHGGCCKSIQLLFLLLVITEYPA